MRRSGLGRSTIAVVLAIALSLAAITSGCGGSSKPTLTIGAGSSGEEQVLGEIYAQALEAAGYPVTRSFKLGKEAEGGPQALERGRVSGYPSHLSAVFTSLLGRELKEAPSNPGKSYAEAKAALKAKGLTAFQPTPFALSNAVGTLRKTAEERGLKKVSDLRGQANEMTIAGVTGCHERIDCVEGLERLYRLKFSGFIYSIYEETEPFEALRTEFSDLAMLPTTDGRLAREAGVFATLEEDEHLFPAGNAVFLTSLAVIDEAGPDFQSAIVAAQQGLTLAVIQELDAEVELDGRTPATAAGDYLRGLGGA